MPKGVHRSHRRGAEHYRWNAGAMTDSQGYRLLRVGVSHPAACPNGYAREHVVLWMSAYGKIPEGHIIHHCNGNRQDNRLDNLRPLLRSEHNRLHNRGRKRDAGGRWLRVDHAGRDVSETPGLWDERDVLMQRVGKKAAGRVLDGRAWEEMPA